MTILPSVPDDGPGNEVGGVTGAPVAKVPVSLDDGTLVGKGAFELGGIDTTPLDG